MIGEVIRQQRNLKEMTQRELAEEVCSTKYIYLIENNKRNPSAYILNQLSKKLNIDLFEYYQYLEFQDTTLVVEYKKTFDKYIQLGDIKQLKKEALNAAQLEDFKQEPLSYDLIIIELLYEGIIENKTSKTINKLTTLFENEKLNIDSRTLINGYVVLSACYQIEGELDKAKKVLEKTYDMVKEKKAFTRYHTAITNVLISLTSLFYNLGDYEELKKYSKILLKFQEKNNQYSRIYYAYYYLSVAYYKSKRFIEAEEFFMKGLHAALLFNNKMDINIIVKTRDFDEMVNQLDINSYYIGKIYALL